MKVYLGVGSNVGDRQSFLEQAKVLIAKIPQTRYLQSSSVIETDPVGGPPFQGKFLNAAWEIETKLAPTELKRRLQAIEAKLGRRRSILNVPREIDLDILLYGDQEVREEGLVIPHPRFHERAFVLIPLAELIPQMRHPILKKRIKELLKECEASIENHP